MKFIKVDFRSSTSIGCKLSSRSLSLVTAEKISMLCLTTGLPHLTRVLERSAGRGEEGRESNRNSPRRGVARSNAVFDLELLLDERRENGCHCRRCRMFVLAVVLARRRVFRTLRCTLSRRHTLCNLAHCEEAWKFSCSFGARPRVEAREPSIGYRASSPLAGNVNIFQHFQCNSMRKFSLFTSSLWRERYMIDYLNHIHADSRQLRLPRIARTVGSPAPSDLRQKRKLLAFYQLYFISFLSIFYRLVILAKRQLIRIMQSSVSFLKSKKEK